MTDADKQQSDDFILELRTRHVRETRASTHCCHRVTDWIRPLTTDSQHVLCCLVHLDEDSVVDLPQSEQLQHLLHLRGHLVDTTDSHDEDKLGLGWDVEVTLLLGIALQPDRE